MMTATMDLMAMYKYDPTLFDDIVLPAGIDRDTLINCLVMDTAEMEIIYPRPDFLKTALTTWSYKQLPVWTKLYESTMFEYNPIWNKDGTIVETETRNLAGTDYTTNNTDRVDNLQDKNTKNFQDKNTRNFQDLETRNLSDQETRNLNDQETRNLTDTNTHSVYGFNSSTEAPESKDVTNGTGTDTFSHTGTDTTSRTGTDNISHTGTDTVDHTGTDTFDHTGRQDIDTVSDKKTTDTGTIKHERTEQGNIGLTSTQQLIKEEREVDQFNIYDYIINDFRQRFCLALY